MTFVAELIACHSTLQPPCASVTKQYSLVPAKGRVRMIPNKLPNTQYYWVLIIPMHCKALTKVTQHLPTHTMAIKILSAGSCCYAVIKMSKQYWYWVWQPIKVLASTQYYPILVWILSSTQKVTQYPNTNIVLSLAKGRWRSVAGNLTVGLVSQWPCVTDLVVSPPTGSVALTGRWAPCLCCTWAWLRLLWFFDEVNDNNVVAVVIVWFVVLWSVIWTWWRQWL